MTVTSSKIYVKVLNEENTVVQEIDTFRFYSGEDRILKCQLWHEANDAAYVLVDPATVTFLLPTNTGFDLEQSGSVDSINRSIVTATLNSVDTAKLITGDIRIQMEEASSIRIAETLKGCGGIELLS